MTPAADHRSASGARTGAAPADPFGWLTARAEVRRRAGLVRVLRPRAADSAHLDLAGNDYLGLARHPEVTRAAADAALRWGAGSTGSRLVTGSTELHARLEAELAEFCGFEAALVFATGYAANLAAVTALSGPDALIVSDEANHASLIDGCRLARARRLVVPHRDPEAVGKALDGHPGSALVVTDSVFSVDGDAAPLAGLAEVCRTAGAALLVDDAHGLGVLGAGGRGLPASVGLAGAPGVVATVTLSKALGAQGGAVLGPAPVIEHLVNSARTFIFDTGLAPAAVGGALAALRLLRREPERAERARQVASLLHHGVTAAGLVSARPDACVLSVRAPCPESAVRWAADCRVAGVAVGCFRPPSVPDGISRLRLSARADLTDREVARAVDVIAGAAPEGAKALASKAG
ncbi:MULTISPECIES: 8-amino-7-oxononanoate synthase [Streptomycetaceae]|uniref:8-amino-7-oxononanoate synthase n=1 Tax=Streptantibioticus cattleyicolor (strain ATCC 35852 / DSM 46488 / JCM 4925 / NBRC 14057 / NRRL 8057) TaxID=1003195 RepID=F8JPN8_STREN|nr:MULTISPECIES: 8-amino-7-oxononanoate synthase [Streptomycetaceae]AEW92730.1 8-amino-7-oxononanoate synthase [Streptantibioticus cattleyicolor NRRL 8057 = DSM 46488]MYS57496.1 aminotransferase class I/II-fold pyridoxal phosphate-dependent enzyme [Streptomyces sp. SID5468]CCB73084.1 8-amino-7-oxononanoate synthase [Streptantibioticus cattleyicolor NRRL 8057 = DSM 46488]